MNPTAFSLRGNRHTKAAPNPLHEPFRPVTELGRRQIKTLVKQLHGQMFDTIYYTPTSRTGEVALALNQAGHEASRFKIIEGIYPPIETYPELWELFRSNPGGNAPNDFANHKHISFFKKFCADAAEKLIDLCQGHNDMLIAHGTITQGVFVEIARALNQHNVADAIENIALSEGDGIVLTWTGTTLTHEYVPLS